MCSKKHFHVYGISICQNAVLLTVLFVFCNSMGISAERPFVGKWEVGDWWKVKCYGRFYSWKDERVPRSLFKPEHLDIREHFLSISPYYAKFVVKQGVNVEGEECHVIGLYEQEGLMENADWREVCHMMIRKSDGTLAELAWEENWLDGKVKQRVQRFDKGRPARRIGLSEKHPIDVPFFPLRDPESQWKYHPVGRIDWGVEGEIAMILHEKIMGEYRVATYVTLKNESFGDIRQLWLDGFPWWVRYERQFTENDDLRGGVIRAQMVSFGKRDKESTVVLPKCLWGYKNDLQNKTTDLQSKTAQPQSGSVGTDFEDGTSPDAGVAPEDEATDVKLHDLPTKTTQPQSGSEGSE